MIRVQAQDFDAGAEIDAIRERCADADAGGLCSFIGVVRTGDGADQITSMTLEHYPGMTEKALAGIVEQAQARWSLHEVHVLHRVGQLEPGEPIVFVGVASAHRQAAFEANAFIMDYLKTRAPFWKRESTPEGERWVDAKDSDEQALSRWQSAGESS